jgi:hypothetical protein
MDWLGKFYYSDAANNGAWAIIILLIMLAIIGLFL